MTGRQLTVSFRRVSLLSALGLLIAASTGAAEPVARVLSAEGVVEASHDGGRTWGRIARDASLKAGDVVRVGARSRAALRLPGETVLRLDQHASVTFSNEEERHPVIELLKGFAYFFSRTPRKLTIKTPYVNGTIEGTEFLVAVRDQDASIAVFEGRVLASNDAGKIEVGAGQAATASKGVAPRRDVLARPDDAVVWALYYPSIVAIDANLLAQATPGARPAMQSARDATAAGDVTAALAALDGIAAADRNAAVLTGCASLLLTVGRVDEASEAIAALRLADPQSAAARALGAVIAVSRNDRLQALELAREAARLDPRSADALLALSYACQSVFQLDEALRAMESCVAAQPANALAWARLAELRMATGHRAAAVEAANRAAALAPRIERVQTVLGFTHLAETDARRAREAFEAAIAIDQGAPLPRLGLGLAKIRKGDLAGGRADLETAVALSPRDAQLRSYLGKAYLEEKRDTKAKDQFGVARAMDPRDPTPYLYDAVRAQSDNDPASALRDIQQAIALNDNRAVYRSRLLLDDDLATRGVGLARTYQELGFDRRALVEGWNALDLDPANYSAHRFLSDTYAALPDSEISRASELLLSQLLQPINTLPVQPGLGERRPSTLGSIDPLAPAFNEFSDLFVSDGARGLLSGIAGQHGTYGDSAIGTVQSGPYSFSVGQLYETTDGYRQNNQQSLEAYNVFAQAMLSPQVNVQAEFRYHETKTGDIGMSFGPESYSSTYSEDVRRETARVGLHYAPTPDLDVIAVGAYQTFDQTMSDQTPVGFPPGSSASGTADDNTRVGELQIISRHHALRLVAGLGYYRSDVDELVLTSIVMDEIATTDTEPTENFDAYGYGYFSLPLGAVLTAGLSVDHFNGSPEDTTEYNPKAGLTWLLTPDTRLRAAAFRTFARSFISQQTIEPTTVAGFQQYRDEWLGTTSWTYGAGLDQRLTDAALAGVELTRRTPSVPAQEIQPTGEMVLQHYDSDETGARAYCYWMPCGEAAFSAEYLYDRTEPEDGYTPFAHDVTTHRVPLACRVFLPGGFTPRAQLSYIDQHRLTPDMMSGEMARQSDNFWILDVGLGYRLPKRNGTLALELRNLTDRQFEYEELDPLQPVACRERTVLVKLTLSF
jgi:tetratricopeptide (TPR) repeat protein